MTTATKRHDRITISLPHGYLREIKSLAAELAMSQSELIATAFDAYRQSQKKQKIQEMAQMMADEYCDNSELIALTALDSEDFR